MNIVEMDNRQVPLWKMFLTMALPSVLNMVTTMVYSIADTWFISATGNTALIAGVSLNTPLFILLMAFGNVFGQGGSTLLSQLIGQRDMRTARHVSAACFYLGLAVGIAAGAVMLLFRTPILYLLGASEATFPYALAYYRWLAVGAPLIVLSYVSRNTMRAEGMAAESMACTMSGTFLNLILDPILIFGFGLGAAGAAEATVIAYVLTNVSAIFVMRKKSTVLSVSVRETNISKERLAAVFSIGIPSALTNVLQSISGVLTNQFLGAYGDDRIAAMGIAMKIAMVGQTILVGISFGVLPLFAYYYGGKNRERFLALTRFSMKVILGLGAVLTVCLFLPAPFWARLFVSDPALVQMCAQMLRLQVISLIFVGLVLILTIIFQSMSRTKEMFFLSISRQGIIFLAVLLIASRLSGYLGIISSQAISDVISAAIAVFLYVRLMRQDKS